MCTGLDKKQRMEILEIVKTACESFEEDSESGINLKGTFYDFKTMKEKERMGIVDSLRIQQFYEFSGRIALGSF